MYTYIFEAIDIAIVLIYCAFSSVLTFIGVFGLILANAACRETKEAL